MHELSHVAPPSCRTAALIDFQHATFYPQSLLISLYALI